VIPAAGIYIHLPFCSSICPYCDFAVVKGSCGIRAHFVESLTEEIRICAGSVWPAFVGTDSEPSFDSIFLGGGTPSIIHTDQLHNILDQLAESFDIVGDPWIAMEVNPEDVTPAQLSDWRELGVSYLSLGVQSFDARSLEFLGRQHTPGQARESVGMAMAAGFPTVSIDLIYCLPGQTQGSWRSELSCALDTGPDHLSCYQLTIEPGTEFGVRKRQGRLSEISVDQQAALFFETHSYLESEGYTAYEVSNFASDPRHESRHNQKYWNHQPYLGLGPSAHSFSGRSRWWNHPGLKHYLAAVDLCHRPIAENETLDSWQICLEAIALGLRTPRGIDLQDLPGDKGPTIWRRNQALLHRWVESGLIDADPPTFRPTLKGMALADTLSRELDIPMD